jgi:hypothetical protein
MTTKNPREYAAARQYETCRPAQPIGHLLHINQATLVNFLKALCLLL